MDTKDAVAARIVELCGQKGLAFNALANLSGVPPSTVKGILNGASRNPGVVTVKKLCDGLGISLTDFFDTDTFRNLEQEIK